MRTIHGPNLSLSSLNTAFGSVIKLSFRLMCVADKPNFFPNKLSNFRSITAQVGDWTKRGLPFSVE